MSLHLHVKGKIRMFGDAVRLRTMASGCYTIDILSESGEWVNQRGECWDYFANARHRALQFQSREMIK